MFVCVQCHVEKDEETQPIQINKVKPVCWQCLERNHDAHDTDLAAHEPPKCLGVGVCEWCGVTSRDLASVVVDDEYHRAMLCGSCGHRRDIAMEF